MPGISREMSKKPGTLNKAIKNTNLKNACIAGQGQKVILICKDDKNAGAEIPVSEGLEFEKLLRLLESGIDVDQSIHIAQIADRKGYLYWDRDKKLNLISTITQLRFSGMYKHIRPNRRQMINSNYKKHVIKPLRIKLFANLNYPIRGS
ncbi:hypothetical protein AGABI2DRAFT_139973 [Agaricus bisporus var. bisporus H97]|uniref:hypothetical protein n=1 Tax=Agaricus bisporus var. bisporus (strain H97 / ATCC MYA-4626 / FGSC 10389) TaxID=936046 RepID=UPI00029F6F3B|nr:hypothetical protein AGABI2DRAFT_139973 [Agaricus bisporus var. bisporus H97]EKV50807.1 hypothetical protein AGABI2DRAFT_139973 [Agaricus bisporus var. bisporus H97]